MSAGLRPRSSDTDPPVKRSRAASSVISAHQWCVFTSLRAACNTREARSSRVAHCSRLSSSRRSSATVSLRRCWSSRSIAAATGARERSLGTRGRSAGGRKVGGGRRGSPGADAIDMTSPGCLRRVADSDTAKLRRAPGRAYPNSAEETVRSSAHSKQLGRRLDPRDSLPRPRYGCCSARGPVVGAREESLVCTTFGEPPPLHSSPRPQAGLGQVQVVAAVRCERHATARHPTSVRARGWAAVGTAGRICATREGQDIMRGIGARRRDLRVATLPAIVAVACGGPARVGVANVRRRGRGRFSGARS